MMKATSISRIQLLTAIFAIEAALAALAYFAVLPFAVPPGLAPGTAIFRSAVVVFLLGLAGTCCGLLVARRFVREDYRGGDFVRAAIQPALLLDQGNRYAAVNDLAANLLGIDPAGDIGKPVDSRVLRVMEGGSSSDPSILNLAATVAINGQTHQIIASPLPTRRGDGGRAHFVYFRDVTSQVRIRDMISDVNNTMAVLNTNTARISSSAVSLSQGATEQASSLAAITSSMDEFSKKIQGSSETASKGTQLAAQAREAAERSGSEIAHALSAMTDVQDAGIRIARIVKLIDDIAFQTNLLALNAAVEAARAGRQGKGFAVVADEVRNLAGRSAKAAKDTAIMVEDVTERIGNASAYISRLEEMLRNIVQDAIRMADSSAVSSQTASEQATGILRVNQELGQMNSVTQSTMSAAEQTAAAVELLAKQVDSLKHKFDGLSALSAKESSEDRESAAGSNRQIDWGGGVEDDRDDYGRAARHDRRPAAINLLDEPGADGRDPFLPFSGPGEYRRIGQEPGDEERRNVADNWELRADEPFDADSSLANMLKSDGYEEDYQKFLRSLEGGDDSLRSGARGGDAPETSNSEGDRMIKPNQNIHLDDSEFGRY